MNGVNGVDGYQDIHHNMRFWLTTLADLLVREREREHARREIADGDAPDGAGAADSAGAAADAPVVIFDIGANDGELTLPLAGRQLAAGRDAARARDPAAGGAGSDGTAAAGPAVQVVAFEPQPAARARLMARGTERKLTVALWGNADLTVVPLALGDRDELIQLEVYSDDTFSSLHSRPSDELERYRLEVVETVQTRMRPLDDLVGNAVVPPPELIKIDVEGAERAVLTGAEDTLSRYHPPVLVEFSCPNCANAGYDRMEIIHALRAAGYDRIAGLFRNEDHGLYPSEAFDDCRIWNILAVNSAHSPAVTATMDRYHTPWRKSP